jgi:hypothetical protein
MKAIKRDYFDIIKQVCSKFALKLGIKDNMGKTEIMHAIERN